MAVTENLYTGNGSTVLYSFTFPYLEATDIKVSINGTLTTAYTLASPTSIQFTTAPANGAAIRIYRDTDDSALAATFYSGAAIRATDLNDNFTQTLYVTQEAVNSVSGAIADVAAAEAAAAAAAASAATAVSTSNTASANASTAIATANSALTAANTATTTANSAVTTANSAVTTANAASVTATAASNAVANALQYTLVANVAAIPSSPTNNQAVEVTNSTGIESFTPLAGKPVGFVGDSGLYVRIVYTTTGSTWNWVQYGANDAESRYLKQTTASSTYAPLASPALTGTPTAPTASANTNTTQVATTAFVVGQAANSLPQDSGVAAIGSSLRYARQDHVHNTDANKADLASPTFTGTPSAPTAAVDTNTTQLATTAYVVGQGYLKSATASSTYAPIASPTFTGTPYVNGSYRGNVVSVAALDIDCNLGNYFTKTISANSTFTVSNVPSSRVYAFTLELTHTSGTVTWFSGVEWPDSTAPTLTTGKTHLFMFVTDDGGTRWRGSSLINYTN